MCILYLCTSLCQQDGGSEQGLAVCLPILGELLDADDADVRRWCAQTLRQISGEAFGYSPADARGHRAAATREWRRWIRANESVLLVPRRRLKGRS